MSKEERAAQKPLNSTLGIPCPILNIQNNHTTTTAGSR